MASSSNGEAKSLQRINDYLNGMQEEFELQSNSSPSACRFNIYIGNLRGEIQLMSLENDCLRKELDEYKAKVKNIRRTLICERCSKEPASPPRKVVSSQATRVKTATSLLSRQLQSRNKSSTSRSVVLTQTRRSTRYMVRIKKLHTAISRTRPFSHTTSRSLDTISHTVTPSSPLSDPIVDEDSGHEDGNWSITFNDNCEKELEVELTHALSHETIVRVKFSQDGKKLAAACLNGGTCIYDVETGTLTCVLRNLREVTTITVVCFSRDGNYLATDCSDEYIYIWEVKTRSVRNAFRHTASSLDFSPNGRLLVSASIGSTVRLWNMRDGSAKDLPGGTPMTAVDFAVFSPDGRYVAGSCTSGIVRIWEVGTGLLIKLVKQAPEGLFGMFSAVKFMPDGKGLVIMSGDTIYYWDISTLGVTRSRSRPRATNDLDGHVSGVEDSEQTQRRRRFKLNICSLAISPDGRWIASGFSDNFVRIWDTRNAAMQCVLNNVHRDVCSVDFSPAGRYLASSGLSTAKIWRYSYMTPGGS